MDKQRPPVGQVLVLFFAIGVVLLVLLSQPRPKPPMIMFESYVDFNHEIYLLDVTTLSETRLTKTEESEFYSMWSPDGRKIVYAKANPDAVPLDITDSYEIYTLDADTNVVHQVTDNRVSDTYPAWSPDSTEIAFVRQGKIYRMNPEGGGQRQLSPDNVNDWNPVWSPDGKHIAFLSNPTGLTQVYLMDADGGSRRPLAEHQVYDFLAWSPDSRYIGYISLDFQRQGIYVVDIQNGSSRWLTSFNIPLFAWSPNGRHIAFTGRESRDADQEIYVIEAAGDNLLQLTDNDVVDTYPVWSPDGSHIAFLSRLDGNAEIYLIKPDGSELEQLTDSFTPKGRFAWRP